MNVLRNVLAIAAAMSLSGCVNETAPGPVGSTSGREKGTPTAAAGTPAQGGAPVQDGATAPVAAPGATPAAAPPQPAKPADGGHAK